MTKYLVLLTKNSPVAWRTIASSYLNLRRWTISQICDLATHIRTSRTTGFSAQILTNEGSGSAPHLPATSAAEISAGTSGAPQPEASL